MSETSFKPGDDVRTPRSRGTVIDVRATPSGAWVFGIEDADGAVGYFTSRALRPAED
ncbi:hypothetical protein [Microbacterium immunditiarum]|uniref:SH3 domain-containing protein n=1 Tax=Microbacterium immunditiarum TaxID=337480 RepID=A0A7Y9KJX2_9MICO|nr:hypothetical protein [Microbacterium immunditiarum]NYE18219.1 hypothetical protein [Microbacterium immunditiarum]